MPDTQEHSMPEVSLRINEQNITLSVDTNETLLDTLRDRLHLIGAKRGCDTGDCGACTVIMDGKTVNACLVLTVEASNCVVKTVEGITHEIQDKFAEKGSFQCGFCAPGVVVNSIALLETEPNPNDDQIKNALAGNLCRCTGYTRILQALKDETEQVETEPNFTVVGKPVTRKDIADKIRGKARFTADLYFPEMVYGALVTSPHPYAKINAINTAEASAMENVLLVLTSDDVPTTPYGVSPARYDETILPQGIVRHVGEAVAAVFATDRRSAEIAASKVQVDYETLPAVFDPETAILADSPQLHEKYPGNINTEIHQDFGNLEESFSDADYIREDVFQGQRTHQAYLEPPVALAMEEGDLINVWTANQNPHLVQVQLARVLDIPKSQLRVMTPAIGGGFGGKAETTKLEFLSVIAARRLHRPVLMTMDRKQAFQHGRGRHAQTIKFKSAFKKDGTLLGTHQEVTLDGGAYTSYGIITAYYSGNLLPILYKMDAFRFDAHRIYTNLPTCGAMRGNGTPQPRFAFESHLDIAAKDMGLSPVEIRRKNLVEANYLTLNELQITSCALEECLDKAVEITDFDNKYGQLPFGKGIGISLGSFVSGAGYPIIRGDYPQSACTIRVGEDGEKVFLYAGTSEIGQGSDTVLCQMVAEELGIKYEHVTILHADSAVTPTDLGSYASRVTFMAGNAVLDAAKSIKSQLAEFWNEIVGESSTQLVFTNNVISDGVNTVPFNEITTKYFRRKGPLIASGMYNPPKLGGDYKGATVGTSPAYSFGAMVAEVDVDVELGTITVEKVYAVHDSGTIINPVTLAGQVEGAIVMGLGETLMENIEHKNGHLRNPNFHDYLIPTIADVPEIVTISVPGPDPNGPFGAKEVGEGSILPVMGAIANAIEDAVGVRIKSLPITANKVFQALQSKS